MTWTRAALALSMGLVPLVFACGNARAQTTTCVPEHETGVLSTASARTWMSVQGPSSTAALSTPAAREAGDETGLVIAALSLAAVGAGLIILGIVLDEKASIPIVILGATAGALGLGLGRLAALASDARERHRLALSIGPLPGGGIAMLSARF